MEEKWMYSLWGAAAGAAALAVVGFTWGGWTTGSNAEAMALKRSQAAVVAVLTPICIQRFQANANAPVKLAELKNIGVSWLRISMKNRVASTPMSSRRSSKRAKSPRRFDIRARSPPSTRLTICMIETSKESPGAPKATIAARIRST